MDLLEKIYNRIYTSVFSKKEIYKIQDVTFNPQKGRYYNNDIEFDHDSVVNQMKSDGHQVFTKTGYHFLFILLGFVFFFNFLLGLGVFCSLVCFVFFFSHISI